MRATSAAISAGARTSDISTAASSRQNRHHDGDREQGRLPERRKAQANRSGQSARAAGPRRYFKNLQDPADYQHRTDVGGRVVARRDYPREEDRQCGGSPVHGECYGVAAGDWERSGQESAGPGRYPETRQAIGLEISSDQLEERVKQMAEGLVDELIGVRVARPDQIEDLVGEI
jgi:hypothetical protein